MKAFLGVLAAFGVILIVFSFSTLATENNYYKIEVQNLKNANFMIERDYLRLKDKYEFIAIYSPLVSKANTYGGGQVHNVPWDKWTIEEKMYLCAYGSSGNKLNKQDLKEIIERYGVK